MSRLSRLAVLLLSCSVLPVAGCIDLGTERPHAESYLLNVEPNAATKERAIVIGARLRFGPVEVSPRYAGRELVYRMTENNYVQDHYHRFLVDPSTMLSEEIGRWLKAAGLFEQVLRRADRLEPDYILQASIPALYGDFTRKPPVAVMAIEFTLLRDRPAGPELILHQAYRRAPPLSEKSPPALVKGFDQALRDILTEFEKDLRKVAPLSGETD